MPSPTPLAAVLVLAVAVSGPAWSETIGEYGPVTVTLRVPVGDLDLAQPSGADELLRRVRAAARRACGGEPAVSPLLLEERRMFRACTDRAVGQAVASLDAPMVNQRYAQLTGPVSLQLAQARP
jgi:UrcA family protein